MKLALVLSLLALFTISVVSGLNHPGVLINSAQLDYIKKQVAAKAEPEYTAYQKALNADIGSQSYKHKGPPSGGVIECGSYSDPDIGCSDDDKDGSAAYLQAVLYNITGNAVYKTNSIALLNAYSKVTKFTDSNAPLQAAWSSSKWSRAAELMAYTGSWSAGDIAAYKSALKSAYLSQIENGSTSNGNWELSMIEGLIGIAVFLDDQTLFNKAVTMWKQRVPAYFYYSEIDGNKHAAAPRGDPSWYGQAVFNKSVDGVAQETCRDFGHTQYGLAATLNAASTAYAQGVDLFGSEQPRLVAAMEFHAKFLNGEKAPHYLCDGKALDLLLYPTWELGYNHFHNKMGVAMPNTLELITNKVRKLTYLSDSHMSVWETLTSSGTP